MSILISAVVLVGLLAALNLVLNVGVVRRLREHTELLARASNPRTAIGAGESVGPFETTMTDSRTLAMDDLVGENLIAFFSTTCEPCEEKLPKFIDLAKVWRGGRDQVVAVVVGDPADATWRVADLEAVARVVVEETDGAVSTAFGVRGYPTVLVTGPGPEGQLVVTEDRVQLEARVPVRA
ncbi:hypothetical protein BLA60_03450 [Actinophytocola xinjiangensis]|uniref:Alkyl hydroperoxide reductase subunit C/ Thiol specific antioxidant domain-containing protein n=1 Tax=Actinophytocola xinjiangensis TaxID=485602 RepID=A0A7Z0WTI8_9PSEU|nr:TlpA disulfide reductase family protein [Actinophytocola xinjiangensis]OLF14209.1 hypothetical protein BLA60_03450 [Actinophytocola xinjiangensis]